LRQMFQNEAFPFLTGVLRRLVPFACPDARLGRASGCIHAWRKGSWVANWAACKIKGLGERALP
jgi:hypothetical protein